MGTWKARGFQLEREFCKIACELDGDAESRIAGGAYLQKTNAAYHGGPQAWDLVPKILDPDTYRQLEDAAETMHGIMEATVAHCVADPLFCTRFGLPPSFHDLLACPPHYDSAIPLARADLFLDEATGDYWFCEVNTDGTFGFTVADEVTEAIRQSASFHAFAHRHPGIQAFNHRKAWMDTLLSLYCGWDAPADTLHPTLPAIALVDYPESVEAAEVTDFVRLFRETGIDARFADIRSLRVERAGGVERLCDDTGPISCAWLRVVTGELLEKPCSGTEALSHAARENLACLVGGYRTWPVAMKTFFAVLHEEDACAFLSPSQRAFVRTHIPETHILAPGDNLDAYADRARWIAKPAGGYNGAGVVAGLDVEQDSWMRTLRTLAQAGGVVQRYIPPFRTPSLPGNAPALGSDPAKPARACNMEGLFLFDGKFSGMYSRCGTGNVIGEFTGRLNQGCLVVDE